MKRLIKAVFCAAATVAVFFGVQYAFDVYIQKSEAQQVFETGSYTDYYYTKLSETEKQAYTAVKQQVYDFPKSIKVPPLDSESLKKVLEALICDNPYMFMFDSCTLMTVGYANYFEPKYLMTAEEYDMLRQQTEQKADSILSALPETGDYEKQLYLHDSVINACSYSDTDTAAEANATGVFINSKAKCSGYAKAYKLLLDKAGIPCVLISGYAEDYDGNGTNHMWVATQTDGVWSYTDITWDDPVTDNGKNLCRRVYFCMSEDMLRSTHSEFEFSQACPDTGLYYYKANNLYYNDYNNNTLLNISHLISAAANSGSTQAEFMFANTSLLKEAENALFASEDIYGVLTKATEQSHNISTDHIRYNIDYNTNLITLFFELKD